MKLPAASGRMEFVIVLVALAVTAVALMLLPNGKGVFVPVAILALPLGVLLWFQRPIHVLVFLLLFLVNFDFIKLGGSGITLDLAVSLVLMVLLVFRLGPMAGPSAGIRVEVWMGVFLFTVVLSMMASVDLGQSVKRFGRELEYLLLFAFLVRYPLTRSDMRKLVGAIIFSSAIPSVLAVVGYMFRIDAFMGQELFMENLYQGEARAQGTLSHPVTLALYLIIPLSLTLVLLYRNILFSRAITVPLLVLQFLAMYLSYGRTGWVGFMGAVVALLVVWGKRKFLLLGVPVLLVLAWKVVPNFQQRMITVTTESDNNSLVWRFGLWLHALDLYPRKPILGSGFGTFEGYVNYLDGFGPHQTWIGLLVETGIVGCLAFFVLLLVTGWSLWSGLRRTAGTGRYLLEAAFAVWVGLFVGSWGGNTFGLPSLVVYFWVIIALALQGNRLWPQKA